MVGSYPVTLEEPCRGGVWANTHVPPLATHHKDARAYRQYQCLKRGFRHELAPSLAPLAPAPRAVVWPATLEAPDRALLSGGCARSSPG